MKAKTLPTPHRTVQRLTKGRASVTFTYREGSVMMLDPEGFEHKLTLADAEAMTRDLLHEGWVYTKYSADTRSSKGVIRMKGRR